MRQGLEMKDSFAEFYRPSEEQLATLMQEGTIVLDANVLLNPYNVANEGRDALLALLEKVKDRLWVPHQAALEFQRNRARTISDDRKKLQQALTNTQNNVGSIIEQLHQLDLDRRGIGKVFEELKTAFEAVRTRTETVLKDAQKGQPGISLDDPVRERLDKILAGRIGPPMNSQADLDALFKDGEHRYALQVPPGFEDKGKDDHRYHHAGLTYQAKYGDLLLWKQAIAYSKMQKLQNVVLVTLDRKRDWWVLQEGKDILGPQPNLISEMCRDGDVKLFWLLHLPEFMHLANKYLSSTISEAAIDQVVASDPPQRSSEETFIESPLNNAFDIRSRDTEFLQAAWKWLSSMGFKPEFDESGYNDILSSFGENRVPIDLLDIRGWQTRKNTKNRITSAIASLSASAQINHYPYGILLINCNDEAHARSLVNMNLSTSKLTTSFHPRISVRIGIVRDDKFLQVRVIDID